MDPFDIPSFGYIPEFLQPQKLQQAQLTLSKLDKRANPGLSYSEEQSKVVENLAALGQTVDEIGAILRIDPKVLSILYEYELKSAGSRVNAAVARTALGMALSGANPDMTKFWLKARAGWVEKTKIEHTGAGGGPIEFAEIKQSIVKKLYDELSMQKGPDGVYEPVEEGRARASDNGQAVGEVNPLNMEVSKGALLKAQLKTGEKKIHELTDEEYVIYQSFVETKRIGLVVEGLPESPPIREEDSRDFKVGTADAHRTDERQGEVRYSTGTEKTRNTQ